MKTFKQALQDGFAPIVDDTEKDEILRKLGADNDSSWMFAWKDGKNIYELWFEKLLWNDQYYVALYKNREVMTEKVVVKPGYEKEND